MKKNLVVLSILVVILSTGAVLLYRGIGREAQNTNTVPSRQVLSVKQVENGQTIHIPFVRAEFTVPENLFVLTRGEVSDFNNPDQSVAYDCGLLTHTTLQNNFFSLHFRNDDDPRCATETNLPLLTIENYLDTGQPCSALDASDIFSECQVIAGTSSGRTVQFLEAYQFIPTYPDNTDVGVGTFARVAYLTKGRTEANQSLLFALMPEGHVSIRKQDFKTFVQKLSSSSDQSIANFLNDLPIFETLVRDVTM